MQIFTYINSDKALQVGVVIVALFISAVSAFYSVIGLTAIFTGAVVQVAIMGSALEAGKVATALWVHRHWGQLKLEKLFFTGAVIVLMLINSLGVFGFLSKAHLQQAASINESHSKLETVNQELDSLKLQLRSVQSRKQVLTSIIGKYVELGAATKAVRARDTYSTEIRSLEQREDQLAAEIAIATKSVSDTKLDVSLKEIEVGPISYFAELVYGDDAETHFDSAARILILSIVFVFDPLALLLLISVQRVSANRVIQVPEPTIQSAQEPAPQPVRRRRRGVRRSIPNLLNDV